MYEAFYGLKCRPFLMVPDPEFLYWSDTHRLAITMLRYGLVSRAPITVITGGIGTGKTTLIRHLMAEIPEDLTLGLISNMQRGRGDLLHWAMLALEQEVRDEQYVQTFMRFQDVLIARYAEGRRVALIIDEAQNLAVSQLEELRMLSNINTEKDEILQLILVGQLKLRELLGRPDLEQLKQRISADFHIEPLSLRDTRSYIAKRLQIAGATQTIFPIRSCDLIFEATGGVPRLVNIICDLCLVHGFSEECLQIEEDLIREFLTETAKRGIYSQFTPLSVGPKLVREQP
jgi:type II secretory pathway predicted ATPase ExeA